MSEQPIIEPPFSGLHKLRDGMRVVAIQYVWALDYYRLWYEDGKATPMEKRDIGEFYTEGEQRLWTVLDTDRSHDGLCPATFLDGRPHPI